VSNAPVAAADDGHGDARRRDRYRAIGAAVAAAAALMLGLPAAALADEGTAITSGDSSLALPVVGLLLLAVGVALVFVSPLGERLDRDHGIDRRSSVRPGGPGQAPWSTERRQPPAKWRPDA
jgi:hypothetical protein